MAPESMPRGPTHTGAMLVCGLFAAVATLTGCGSSWPLTPSTSSATAASVRTVAQPAAAPAPVVVNLADDFVRAWEATRAPPTAQRVERIEREVASRFPAFYDLARFKGKLSPARRQQQWAAAIENFGPLREGYEAKVAAFESQLGRNLASFTTTFPDYKGDASIVLLHSLGEMDGGVRELDGRRYLIFGADVMARLHSWADESAFFHHELFHVHHVDRFGDCEPIWCRLWQEGLAVYVAQRLNPGAGPAELLLDFPAGMVEQTKRQLPTAFARLQRALLQTDAQEEARLFIGGPPFEGDALPRRHGYYLGFLVAEELARTHSLQELARLNEGEAKGLVKDAVDRLADRLKAPQQTSIEGASARSSSR